MKFRKYVRYISYSNLFGSGFDGIGGNLREVLPAQNSLHHETILRDGWKFQPGPATGAWLTDFDDTTWENVRVPHDWAIEAAFIPDGDGNTGKLPWKGEGWYRKQIQIPATESERRYYLVCDGIMAFPEIYLNGTFAGKWDYGYNSFYLDVTPFIQPGAENLLAIHVDTRRHDSRWYPGAGIFRKIRLLSLSPVHLDIWGTQVSTPIIKSHYADVSVRTTIKNQREEPTLTRLHFTLRGPAQELLAEQQQELNLAPGSFETETFFTVPSPQRWDINSPALYSIHIQVLVDGQIFDESVTPFGIRKSRFDPDHGYYLNDRRVQIQGVNLHHDLGPLGAAFNRSAKKRQLEILKEMGCNAIRTSHNAPAPETLELCDSMGLLVIDELFDKYDAKADIVDTTQFEAFAERQVRNFIRRDRNHPSIILWSVGNEIGDVQWNIDGGFHKLRTMVNLVRKYDPYRPVTLVCDNEKSAALRHFDFYDVHAWNYGRRYKLARQIEPNKAVIISESASTLSTRGFYEFPLPEQKTEFTKSLQVSSYDLNAPWWAEIADDDFMWQQEEEYIAGEFVWTGFDYLGEPTPYDPHSIQQMGLSREKASRSSYFGILDLCGIPKDRYYLYKSHWKPEENTLHILPHWNWPERMGKNVPVFVYTNGDCAELFLNGRSMGMRCKNPKSENSTDRFRLIWKDVVYEPGEIKAVAYKDGQVIETRSVITTGEPVALKLTPETGEITANGEDIAYILVEAVDEEGRVHPLANDAFEVELSGEGTLAGIGNGNPQSLDPFKDSKGSLFYGKAMILVQSTGKKGDIRVTVQTKELGVKSTTLISN